MEQDIIPVHADAADRRGVLVELLQLFQHHGLFPHGGELPAEIFLIPAAQRPDQRTRARASRIREPSSASHTVMGQAVADAACIDVVGQHNFFHCSVAAGQLVVIAPHFIVHGADRPLDMKDGQLASCKAAGGILVTGLHQIAGGVQIRLMDKSAI